MDDLACRIKSIESAKILRTARGCSLLRQSGERGARKFIEVAEARDLAGLRLVLTRGVPHRGAKATVWANRWTRLLGLRGNVPL
jgi:hypothetical protein